MIHTTFSFFVSISKIHKVFHNFLSHFQTYMFTYIAKSIIFELLIKIYLLFLKMNIFYRTNLRNLQTKYINNTSIWNELINFIYLNNFLEFYCKTLWPWSKLLNPKKKWIEKVKKKLDHSCYISQKMNWNFNCYKINRFLFYRFIYFLEFSADQLISNPKLRNITHIKLFSCLQPHGITCNKQHKHQYNCLVPFKT